MEGDNRQFRGRTAAAVILMITIGLISWTLVLGAQNLVIMRLDRRVRYPSLLPHLVVKQMYHMAVFLQTTFKLGNKPCVVNESKLIIKNTIRGRGN